MKEKVRVRFAPSPTGGLHLGGVRTVLYNYLYARKHQGTFILRIEDTDQTRFVEGAEQYIFNCLSWCGLEATESPLHGGEYGPYRQSERKKLYKEYAEKLVHQGNAYYAFDSIEELELMREKHKTAENPSPQYDATVRMEMKNSLNLSAEEVNKNIDAGIPYVIRIKMPQHETISFTDLIHGDVRFDASLVDDKVLLKADGMPTYHLAVVVDDFLMKITHAFRGEEWLSSAPVHIMLWKYLFGLENMPQWAHLPLILGPHGKLSKRDGAKYGFPVFAMNWKDPGSEMITEGFKEKGFLPEAFLNLLAVLGWNDGTEQEIFTLEEMAEKFSIDRVHKAGAKFDYEKARWFNHEWIKRLPVSRLLHDVQYFLQEAGFHITDLSYLEKVVELVKDRCVLLTDFSEQAGYFFNIPGKYDLEAVLPKWDASKKSYFESFVALLENSPSQSIEMMEESFKTLAIEKGIKTGELQMLLRVMLVGSKMGPAVFVIADTLSIPETCNRIKQAMKIFDAEKR